MDSLAFTLNSTQLITNSSGLVLDTIYNDTLMVIDYNDPNDPFWQQTQATYLMLTITTIK